MTRGLDKKRIRHEAVDKVATPDRRTRRGLHRSQFGDARDPARQLGAHRFGGLVPGGHRRRMAQHIQALPASPSRIGWVSSPAPMKTRCANCGRIRWREVVKGGFASTLTRRLTSARRPAVIAALDTASDGYHNPAAVWWALHLPWSRRHRPCGHRQTPAAGQDAPLHDPSKTIDVTVPVRSRQAARASLTSTGEQLASTETQFRPRVGFCTARAPGPTRAVPRP